MRHRLAIESKFRLRVPVEEQGDWLAGRLMRQAKCFPSRSRVFGRLGDRSSRVGRSRPQPFMTHPTSTTTRGQNRTRFHHIARLAYGMREAGFSPRMSLRRRLDHEQDRSALLPFPFAFAAHQPRTGNIQDVMRLKTGWSGNANGPAGSSPIRRAVRCVGFVVN